MPRNAHRVVAPLLNDWEQARAALRDVEAAERPDLTDRFGRTWQWKAHELYTHDGLLATIKSVIESPDLDLPAPSVADNPNYAGLCSVCKSRWPQR